MKKNMGYFEKKMCGLCLVKCGCLDHPVAKFVMLASENTRCPESSCKTIKKNTEFLT